jgi:hypothetical protein
LGCVGLGFVTLCYVGLVGEKEMLKTDYLKTLDSSCHCRPEPRIRITRNAVSIVTLGVELKGSCLNASRTSSSQRLSTRRSVLVFQCCVVR